jgi:hypothetical protein
VLQEKLYHINPTEMTSGSEGSESRKAFSFDICLPLQEISNCFISYGLLEAKHLDN